MRGAPDARRPAGAVCHMAAAGASDSAFSVNFPSQRPCRSSVE
jgi:hypothetical protein